MKTLSMLSFLLAVSYSPGYAKEADTDVLAASAIPEGLKKDAHAIFRYDNTALKIRSLDEVTCTRKFAVTILDEKGSQFANLTEGYNQLVKIQHIKGRLLDAEGKEIKTLKEKEISDYSTFGTSFVYHSDSRVKFFSFRHTSYPYTVVYEIEETIKTTFFLPDWQPQTDNDCAVESATFTLTYPDYVPVRYKEYLMPKEAEKNTVKSEGQETTTWKVKNIAAYENQPFSNTGGYNMPTVAVAAGRFELLKHKGDMQSWQSLGAFFYELNKDRDILPEDKKALVRSLVASETDTYGKIQKLYSYMQQNTRYVANEYGIAGWQTFDAESVAKNGYGDCKGLTNYLKAMLKEAGIPAYAALVYAGEQPFRVEEQFPSNTFNHVILCVPQPQDSIWIECTSQQLPAGYLGSFTQGRKVLLTTENGGFLCSTPSYGKDKSYILRKAVLQLDNNSRQQKIKLQHVYSGLMQDDLEHFLKTQSEDKIREKVNSKFPFPSYSVTHYSYSHSGSQLLPAVEEQAEVMVGGIISSTQKRSFVNLAWMRNPMPEIFQTSPRTRPFVLDESFRITDSVTVELPQGTEIETMPQARNFKYPFAEYHIHFEKKGDKVSMIRTYEQNEGTYEAADFDKFRQLYRTINAEKDNLSIVLLNKTP
jgi:transglutaminase-like putative cysteine protease